MYKSRSMTHHKNRVNHGRPQSPTDADIPRAEQRNTMKMRIPSALYVSQATAVYTARSTSRESNAIPKFHMSQSKVP